MEAAEKVSRSDTDELNARKAVCQVQRELDGISDGRRRKGSPRRTPRIRTPKIQIHGGMEAQETRFEEAG